MALDAGEVTVLITLGDVRTDETLTTRGRVMGAVAMVTYSRHGEVLDSSAKRGRGDGFHTLRTTSCWTTQAVFVANFMVLATEIN
jgi:hypothetical protein